MERISDDDDTTSKKLSPILTGVSAGSLIAAAISTGVTPEDAMSVVLAVAERTKEKGGVLDVLRPGFSLVDEVEDLLRGSMQKALGGSSSSSSDDDHDNDDYDNELLLNRIQNGDLLRIGMADRRTLNLASVKRDLSSYLYADRYRNLKDITSACILSSYIPIGTGPLLGESDPKNLAIKRAWGNIQEMEQRGFLKHGITGLPLSSKSNNNHDDPTMEDEGDDEDDEEQADSAEKCHYIDGGLVNMFPEIDDSTVIISPVNGSYVHPFIAPDHTPSEFQHKLSELMKQFNLPNLPPTEQQVVEISDRVQIGTNIQNVLAAYLMARSSSSDVLEERFRNGYDDTHRFLKEHDLLTTFSG